MNKIYFVYREDDDEGFYVSAPTSKEARKIAYESGDIDVDSFIDFRVKLQRKISNDKSIPMETTFPSSVLTCDEAIREGFSWWCCPNCGEREFEIMEPKDQMPEHYMCKKCRYEGEIPYE